MSVRDWGPWVLPFLGPDFGHDSSPLQKVERNRGQPTTLEQPRGVGRSSLSPRSVRLGCLTIHCELLSNSCCLVKRRTRSILVLIVDIIV